MKQKIEYNPSLETAALLLILLQVLDALLTFKGVHLFGLDAEGNPILRHLFDVVGPLYTLILAKIVASVFIVVLYYAAKVHRSAYFSLIVLNCIYLVFAICPWTLILLTTL